LNADVNVEDSLGHLEEVRQGGVQPASFKPPWKVFGIR